MEGTGQSGMPLPRLGIHAWALLTALATFVLITSGGLVTSKGVGMTVPDWPSTYGYNMFLFPISKWVGGIFYEHLHRLIASGVGLMTVILSILLFIWEPRRWVKVLGVCAVIAVIIQGVLGGMRVVLYKNEIGIFHGMLAQSFLLALGILCVVTSPSFNAGTWFKTAGSPILRTLALAIVVGTFLQLGIAATMRHAHLGLAIPDFPLAYGAVWPDTGESRMTEINAARVAANQMPTTSFQIHLQMLHRIVAIVLAAAVFAFAILAFRRASTPLWLRGTALVWVGLIIVQIFLGAWTIWSNKAADVATGHVIVGAVFFLFSGLLAFRLCCANAARKTPSSLSQSQLTLGVPV